MIPLNKPQEEPGRSRRPRVPDRPLALYIHVPFCETRCPYCDFNTYAHLEHLMAPYVEAVCRELRLWGATLGHPSVATVFFGGGTPSYLGPEALGRILEAAAEAFVIAPDAEVTAECNPGDLTPERLERLAALPLNRLSIGVQAFQDGHLERLGRRVASAQGEAAYRRAREAGFGNINLDLMYGLPQQTLDEWNESLERALELRPEHLSLYCLTLEPGTPLERWVAEGHVPEPDADLAAEQYLLAEERLGVAGYLHYEISNWSLPGHECRHNLVYWRNGPYLGVGPGAHSSLAGHRFANVASPRAYVERVARWWQRGPVDGAPLDGRLLASLGPVAEIEPIDRATEMGETMMLRLRLAEGVSLEGFRARFGSDMNQVYGPTIAELRELGLVEVVGGRLRLTGKGRLLGNEVFGRFLSIPAR